jgi:hypothetical protein
VTNVVHVEAVVSGRLAASSRFRVQQHVEPLRRLGVEVSAHPPRISKYASLPGNLRASWAARPARALLSGAKLATRLPALGRSWRADVTWLERELLPGHLSLEPVLGRPLVFDVDDAIWLLSDGHERATRAICRRSACVVAGNDFLADWLGSAAPVVERIWTAVDTNRFTPSTADHRGFVLGWTGSGTSLRYLRAITPALARVLDAAADARLVVLSDAFVDLPGIPPERVELVRWTPSNEVTVIQGFDVGLMPLPTGDWAKGKCAFKMLQYMACAVPSVVSPVGMNNDVLAMADVGVAASTDDEWVDAIVSLYRERDRAARLGAEGRLLVERSFSVDVIAPQLAAVMRKVG